MFCSGFSVASQHLSDLVGYQILYVLSADFQILSGIEHFRFVEQHLTNAGGHSQTQVGIDVDLADRGLSGAAQHILRNADGVCQISAVLLNNLYILLRYGGCSVKHDGESGQSLGNFVQNVEAKLGFLAGFELESAVAGSDGDCQGIHAGAGYKLLYLVRMGVGSVSVAYFYIILDTCQLSQLTLFDTVREDDIIKELGEMDLSAMTPIDALNTLYRLQTRLKNRWDGN